MYRNTFIRFAGAVAASACFALASGIARAETKFPTRAVTIIVPFTPGGASDVQARLVGQELSQMWGQSVIVENKPGGSASIGMRYVARAAPDGYTLIVSDLGTLTIGPSLRKLPFDLEKDFAPLTILSYSPYLLTAHPSAPYNTLEELIAYSKANPGKVDYGTSGPGTTPHLAGRLFESKLGLQWTDIHSKGGSQTIQDVVSGQVQLQFNTVFSTQAYVKSGRLKALAVTSAKRLPGFPNLPAVTEMIPGFVVGSYQGIFAPAATPPAILAQLNHDIVFALKSADIQEKMRALGAEPRPGSADDMRRFLKEDRERWAQVVREQHITLGN